MFMEILLAIFLFFAFLAPSIGMMILIIWVERQERKYNK